MNHEDLSFLLNEVFRFRAKIELDKKLVNTKIEYPNIFYPLSSATRGVDLIREQLAGRENIDILCLKEFLIHQQKGLPCISIYIKDDAEEDYRILYKNKTYYLSIRMEGSTTANIGTAADNSNADGKRSDENAVNGRTNSRAIENAFKEIFEMETNRILKQPTKFYDFLQKTDEKAYANFFQGNYTEACRLFAKNEKRVYCEMMRNKRLSLDPELFNYITGKDEENQINIERLTLVYFIVLYSKMTENYTHYAFLYHLIDFENEYINIVLSVEMANMMNILGTHRKKQVFLLYSAALLLYNAEYYEKATKILANHFLGSTLHLKCLVSTATNNLSGNKALEHALQRYRSNARLNFELMDILERFPGIILDVKLNYKLFRVYLNNLLPYDGALSDDEELLIRIYDDIEDVEVVHELMDSAGVQNDSKPQILEHDNTVEESVEYRVGKGEGCTDIHIRSKASFLVRNISFKIPRRTAKLKCELGKEIRVNEDAHFLKIVNQERDVIFSAYQKTEFVLKVISNKARMASIKVNEKFKFYRLLEYGENAIKFDCRFEEGTYTLVFVIRPTLCDYAVHEEASRDICASALEYRLSAMVVKSLGVEVNADDVLSCLEVKMKNFTARELNLENIKFLNDGYQLTGIGTAFDRRKRAERIVASISGELVAQYDDSTAADSKDLCITENIQNNRFNSLVDEQLSVGAIGNKDEPLAVKIDSNSEQTAFLFFKRNASSKETVNHDKSLEQLIFGDNSTQKKSMDGHREVFIRNAFCLNGWIYPRKFETQVLNFFAVPMPHELPITFYFDGITPLKRYGSFFSFNTSGFKDKFFQTRKNVLDWSSDRLTFIHRLDQFSDTPKVCILNMQGLSYVLATNPLDKQQLFEIRVGRVKLCELVLGPTCTRLVQWRNGELEQENTVKVECLSSAASVIYVD